MKFLFIYIKNKMTIKQQLFNSFIKGIGKTFGTAVVFGFFGTVFYMYSNNQSHKHIKNDQEQEQEQDQDNKHLNENSDTNKNNLDKDDVQMSNVNNTEDHIEDNTENNYDDLENIVNSKYKTLFENLLK